MINNAVEVQGLGVVNIEWYSYIALLMIIYILHFPTVKVIV
jgi:hypothetical protein